MQRRSLMQYVSLGMALRATPAPAQTEGARSMAQTSGCVAVNGVELYFEIHGDGSPLVMLHGGVNPADMFGAPLAAMAETMRPIK